MMKAGTYYVGDLCYVLHDRWDEFCDVTISGTHVLSGEMELKDGTPFAAYSTKWGDGQYNDQDGHRYGVDAGLIGCILMEHIDEGLRGSKGDFGGRIVTFYKDFETWEEDGLIRIGHIEIDTDPLMKTMRVTTTTP